MVLIYTGAGFLVLLTVVQSHQHVKDSVVDRIKHTTDGEFNGQRTRRSLIVKILRNTRLKGLIAETSILKDAIRIPSKEPNTRAFQKIGTAKTALKEFEETHPTYVVDVIRAGMVAGKKGNIGDRTITFKPQDDSGNPTIEIVKTHNPSGAVTQTVRITYKQ